VSDVCKEGNERTRQENSACRRLKARFTLWEETVKASISQSGQTWQFPAPASAHDSASSYCRRERESGTAVANHKDLEGPKSRGLHSDGLWLWERDNKNLEPACLLSNPGYRFRFLYGLCGSIMVILGICHGEAMSASTACWETISISLTPGTALREHSATWRISPISLRNSALRTSLRTPASSKSYRTSKTARTTKNSEYNAPGGSRLKSLCLWAILGYKHLYHPV
jgi:hypothetical protein